MTKTPQPKLPLFESHPVSRAAVKITKAGDGLSEALKIDPIALEIGDDVYYVLSGRVAAVNHVEKDDVITRVHVIAAQAITEIDAELADKMLREAAEELQRRKDEVAGQMRLDEEAAAAEREKGDATVAHISDGGKGRRA